RRGRCTGPDACVPVAAGTPAPSDVVADPPSRSPGCPRTEWSGRGQVAGLRTRGLVLRAGGRLLAVASRVRYVGPSACDGGRSRSPLRGSPGFPPGSLLRRARRGGPPCL